MLANNDPDITVGCGCAAGLVMAGVVPDAELLGKLLTVGKTAAATAMAEEVGGIVATVAVDGGAEG